MAISKNKRKEMETIIYETFKRLDPSGDNERKYKDMFSDMTDIQFDNFFKEFFKNDDMYLILDIIDYERTVKIENVEKAAEYLKVPLFEKVAMPFVNNDTDSPVMTKYEVPVGYAHIKRMQQLRVKKNAASTEAGIRSALTGQVSGKDKNARESDIENFALVTLDAVESLREFNGPRADDMVMKSEMYSSIAKKGYVSLNELTNDAKNKTTLNTVDVYFIGMGLKTDLVTKGPIVKDTLR